ncbi:MAG: hypothetical protein EZS28_039461 [Streblomastix strix]|uniref:non-specific serine/threonine protein kinase n=1 Tax=Streblomastix strix TaxID=222440 RepID=A0A5J4U3Q2_9EUKA|nr:MAG: hypothetical protein EZS28_039461 [Streblomastix strix]
MFNRGIVQTAQHTIADFEVICALSSGAFGRIIQMRQNDNNKIVVVKRIQYINKEEKQIADEEVKMLQKVQSKHIVKYLESFVDGLDLCIVMEFCSGGNLRVMIESLKKMTIIDRKMPSSLTGNCSQV